LVKILLVVFVFSSQIVNANTCNISIDIGHSPKTPGATSARGVSEFEFNKILAFKVKEELDNISNIKAKILNPTHSEISLMSRVDKSRNPNVDLFVSIHHDSVKERFLKKWNFLGKTLRYTDKFKGYTVIVSPKNKHFKSSLQAAKEVGKFLLKSGEKPSKYHRMKIKGESKEYFSETYGVMRYDNLVVLKRNPVPAILIEAGVIINREEELRLTDPDFISNFSEQTARGISEWCKKKKHF